MRGVAGPQLAIVLCTCTAFAPSLTRAAGFAFSEQSATASGSGGAGAARSDDAGLAWYNPAALADGGGLRAGLSLTLGAPSITAEARDGSFSAETESSLAPVPHLDLSWSGGDFAVGVAAGVPFGSTVTWPADWPGRRESRLSELAVARVAPFAAYRIGPLRIAAGVHVDFARMRFERKLDFIDEEGNARIDMDGSGFGFDASLFLQATEWLDLGLVYRGRTSLTLAGGADFEAPAPLAERAFDQAASASFTAPDQWVLGARVHHGAWALLADLEVTAWSVYDRLVVDLADPAASDLAEDAHWGTTYALRAGGELALSPALRTRAGFYFDPSAVPDATVSAAVPDSSRFGLSFGASLALAQQWNIDAFYAVAFLARRGTTAAGALPVTYGGSGHFFGLGIRFASTRPVP